MTPAEVRANIAYAFAEVRGSTWPTWQRDMWLGAVWFVIVFPAYIGIPAARPWLVGTIGVAAFAGLVAWGWDLKRELADREDEAQRLHLLLTEAEIAAPVPYVPVVAPRLRIVEQLRPTHDDLTNADDAIWLNLYDENGQHRA